MRLEDAVSDHPKIKAFAFDLGLPKVYAIGHVILLWTWTLRNAPDGDLRGKTARNVAMICDWDRDPEAFVEALINNGLVDGSASECTLRVHDWMKYAAQFREAQKKAKQRANLDAVGTVPGQSGTVPARRRRRQKTKTDPERESARPDATPTDPEPETDATAEPPIAPEASIVPEERSAPLVYAEVVTDEPGAQPGDFGAKMTPGPEPGPSEPPKLSPWDPLAPKSTTGRDADCFLDDEAKDAIGLWNEHRAPWMAEEDPDAEGLRAAVLATMRAHRIAEIQARAKDPSKVPKTPWLHRRSGWIAFAERMRRALFVEEMADPCRRLNYWLADAVRGGKQGQIRREELFAGGYDKVRAQRRSAETAAERQLREGRERLDEIRGGGGRAAELGAIPAWATMAGLAPEGDGGPKK